MKYKIMSLCISCFAFIGVASASMYCNGWYYEPRLPEGLKEELK